MFRLALGLALFTVIQSAVAFGNDVEVYYSNGDVIVKGDADGNDIEIRRLHLSVHQFRGLNGTTINGSSDPVILPIQDDLRIWMYEGDDLVDIRSLYLRGTSHADLVVELGSDHDVFSLRNGSVRRDVTITDRDIYRGNDKITVGECSVGDTLDINTQGIADIRVFYNDCRFLFIDSGHFGDDFVSLVANEAISWVIDTSNEDDHMVFIGNHMTSNARINLHDGNDSIQYSSNGFSGYILSIDGGAGTDTGSRLPRSSDAIFGFLGGTIRVMNLE